MEEEPVAARGLQKQMIVLARLAALGAPAARHAEVKDHMVVAVGRDDAIFGAARQRRDRGAGQPLREVGGKGSAQIGAKRSEEHTSELQSLMRISYAVFCLK